MVKNIILWHHKLTPYQEEEEEEFDDEKEKESLSSLVVEAVRKADWIDATMGILSYGMPRKHILKVQREIKNANFHWTLLSFGPKLHGFNVYKIVTEISSIFKH